MMFYNNIVKLSEILNKVILLKPASKLPTPSNFASFTVQPFCLLEKWKCFKKTTTTTTKKKKKTKKKKHTHT